MQIVEEKDRDGTLFFVLDTWGKTHGPYRKLEYLRTTRDETRKGVVKHHFTGVFFGTRYDEIIIYEAADLPLFSFHDKETSSPAAT